MKYFDFYKLVLNEINTFNPSDGLTLRDKINERPEIISRVTTSEEGIKLGQQFQEILSNLISDGLVNGSITKTKSGNIYILHGLSTTGHEYLEQLKNPKFMDRLKNTLKEEGLPLTPASITRTIAKLIF